jgi:hypothetical protein
MITAKTLRNAASDIEAAERALNLALAECARLKAEVKAIKAERDEYFRPRIDGDVAVNAWRDREDYAMKFRVQAGSVRVTSAVDMSVFEETRQVGDLMGYVAQQAARGIADLIARKIAPLLVEVMESPRSPSTEAEAQAGRYPDRGGE